ncbi:uncharacterized protein [Populus alba]|uniref:uncharacterized protein n=1 Tax=Populus alba TaxID=43335 RepID=UPI003CC72689
MRTKQNGHPVNLYYVELNSVWQEIDKQRPIKMICAADLRTRQEEIQKDRIYDFLTGLDEVFDSIRSDLLRKKSVPSIEECFNTIRREAQRQVTMLGAKNTGEGSSIAMISKSTTPSNLRTLRAINKAEKDKLRCSHCNGKSAIPRDTCFEIHGYPDWFLEKQKQSKARSNKRPVQAKLTTATEIPSSFAAMAISKKDHTKPNELLSLVKTDQTSATCKTGVVLSTSTVHDTGWIIDSGATDHMTYNKSLFQYMTPSSKEKVMTTNGESTPVIGARSIVLTLDLSLHNCLLDIQTQAIIGRGTKRKGLYYVDDVASGHVHQVQSHNERKNKHILETTRALLIGAHVPQHYWVDAVTYVVYLINRMPSQVLSFSTPLKLSAQNWNHAQYGVSFLVSILTKRDTGATILLLARCMSSNSGEGNMDSGEGNTEQQQSTSEEEMKTSTHTISNVGEKNTEPSSRTCATGNSGKENKEYNAHGISDAEEEYMHEEITLSSPQIYVQDRLDIHEVSDTESPSSFPLLSTPCYSLPLRQNRGKAPDRYSPNGKTKYAITQYVSTHKLPPQHQAFISEMENIKIPTKVEDALQHPKWVEAMEAEMSALQRNDTWSIVSLPPGKKPMGCKWIFNLKHRVDDTIDRFKARLVAKGYTQSFSIDYQETFAPVAKMNTIRVLLSLVVNFSWPLKQFDVKNAFLHGDLEEKVYMQLPPGFNNSQSSGKVCRLRKALYGLKQSPRAWFGRFTEAMKRISYHQGKGLTFKRHGNMEVKGFTDADWAGYLTDRRSTSGYFTFVAGNLVTWRSKKQNVTARSSAEAEYRGMVAREIANNPVQHDRTKHIEVDRHFIKEKLLLKLVDILFVRSSEQLAYILTHAVPVEALHKSLDKLGLEDIFAPT